jgi:hypothetical protein
MASCHQNKLPFNIQSYNFTVSCNLLETPQKNEFSIKNFISFQTNSTQMRKLTRADLRTSPKGPSLSFSRA